MDSLTVDSVYGQALFDAAREAGKLEAVAEDLAGVSDVFKAHPALKKLFTVPTLDAKQKKAAAMQVFAGRISRELLNFLCILIEKHRVGAWDGIVRRYGEFMDERDGLTKGILYSVVPVPQEQLRLFETETGKALTKTVRLENRIDATLIGGVKIYVDGKLVDMSIKSRLEAMKQQMLG
jgi:ATP synthase F1 delta subunit